MKEVLYSFQDFNIHQLVTVCFLVVIFRFDERLPIHLHLATMIHVFPNINVDLV